MDAVTTETFDQATFRQVILPSILPSAVTGLRMGFGLTLLGVVLGEMFASRSGFGYELVQGCHWSFDVEAAVTGAHYGHDHDANSETWTNWSLVNFAINFF